MLRRYPFRPMFRVRRRLPSALLPCLLMAAISIGFFRYVSAQMKPLIETMAESKAVNLISLAVAEEVDACLSAEQLAYGDFIVTETGTSGQVRSLSFKTAEGALFRRKVTEGLVTRLEEIDSESLAIPLGNLSGVLLLSALGPSIRVNVQSVGDVTTEYRNEFTSAGVNQTRHSVFLDVTVTIYLLIPGEIIPVTAKEQVCVAETIIIGEVPDTYLNLQNGAD